MKKQLPIETVIEMNRVFWEEGSSTDKVARKFKSSLPVVHRVLTTTREEYLKIKEKLK
jgi:DNA invertase Pin-like site-specific DNA recombinase